MLMAENALALPQNKQNLYTAHEVIQLLPIYNKDNTYAKFLRANRRPK